MKNCGSSLKTYSEPYKKTRTRNPALNILILQGTCLKNCRLSLKNWNFCSIWNCVISLFIFRENIQSITKNSKHEEFSTLEKSSHSKNTPRLKAISHMKSSEHPKSTPYKLLHIFTPEQHSVPEKLSMRTKFSSSSKYSTPEEYFTFRWLLIEKVHQFCKVLHAKKVFNTTKVLDSSLSYKNYYTLEKCSTPHM